MRYYDTLAEYEREGFKIIVDKSYEDLNPRDCFDDTVTDIDEIIKDIDRGHLDWFMLRVRALVDGHELGSSYVGGFLYEDASEVLRDGTADSMIDEAVDEARKEALRLVGSLQRVVDTAAV